MTPTSIAIVGMACEYPDARNPVELWENVLARRQAFRRIPTERLSLADYFNARPDVADQTYSTQAAVLRDYEFDRVSFRVSGDTYRASDPVHWLALDVANRALAAAGFPDGSGLPAESTGVFLGNTLTGEFSRAQVLRLRWPYVHRTVDAVLADLGWASSRRLEFLATLESRYKEPFPAAGPETLAGGLSNTIAGRICNHFNLKGGGYTVDGACASSLLAVTHACGALAGGDLDVVIAGGVDLSIDPFELIGFAKAGALAANEMRVFDANPEGFWPGEGCGQVVLMRLEDARAQNRPVLAMIPGWGVSSDGQGGITRPEAEGQLLALKRAYRRAGFGISSVAYFEGHGTGTAVGDETEIRALKRARREDDPGAPPAAIGSIKANIGHTKAAAGVAGLIKAVMAINSRVIPPITGCSHPHGELSDPQASLHVPFKAEKWPGGPCRAGVSAMGFGGINAHVILEGDDQHCTTRFPLSDERLSRSYQDAELFLFGEPDAARLRTRLEHFRGVADWISRAEMVDAAAALARNVDKARAQVRAALVVSTPDELARGLEKLLGLSADGVASKFDKRAGLFLGTCENVSMPLIGFLFPGQGSPVHEDGGVWSRRFTEVGTIYEKAALLSNAAIRTTARDQPAIVTATLAGLALLERAGITADVGLGHSLGELSALHWGGVIEAPHQLLDLAKARGRAMSDPATTSVTGAMASLGVDAERAIALFDGMPVVIAGFNSPRQTVVSGNSSAIDDLVQKCRTLGIAAVRLPVAHAFHSPLLASAIPAFAGVLESTEFATLQRTVASTISGGLLCSTTKIPELLCSQFISPVRFREAIAACGEIDLWIEVGPGEILSGLASECGSARTISLDVAGRSLRGLLSSVGAAFTMGAQVDTESMFSDRFSRFIDFDRRPRFFANPCESAPASTDRPTLRDTPPVSQSIEEAQERSVPEELLSGTALKPSAIDVVMRLVADRAELPRDAVQAHHKLLGDLHLNSITVSQLVVEAARELGLAPPVVPTRYSNASVAEMATALEEQSQDGARGVQSVTRFPPGVDGWVRPFVVEWVECDRSPQSNDHRHEGSWSVFALDDDPFAQTLREAFRDHEGNGVVVALPPQPDDRSLGLLLDAAQAALQPRETGGKFVLVGKCSVWGGFAKSLHLEAPGVRTVVVEVPANHPTPASFVISEMRSGSGYHEARYDEVGRRYEPVLRSIRLEKISEARLPLGESDVILVTGGGKGIAAECALALTVRTGAKLGIIGRSDPLANSVLKENLHRLRSKKVVCDYEVADVEDAEALRRAISAIQEKHGPITAVIHAAGTNEPRSLIDLDLEAVRATLAPKVDGLRNVLDSLDPSRVRLLVTFGSVIARIGMRGEAHYALANACQTELTERYQAEHPLCRCLSLEWSVWASVGMGERLGRVEALAGEGVQSIPTEAGTNMFVRLLGGSEERSSLVIAGRIGDPPTINVERPPITGLRFLERVLVDYPGVELVAEADISRGIDLYLDDHVLQGECLLPAVIGLEAMAQAVAGLTRRDLPPLVVIEDVAFDRAVVIQDGGPTTIRLAALMSDSGRVEVVLKCQATDYQVSHFRATFRLEAMVKQTPNSLRHPTVTGGTLRLDPVRELYGSRLFQAGRFRRILSYNELKATRCEAVVAAGDPLGWFGDLRETSLLLGDPGMRDATIHAVQACIPHAMILPVGVDRVVADLSWPTGPRRVLAEERSYADNVFTYDLSVFDDAGVLRERWEGLRLRNVGPLMPRVPWPHDLVAPYLERRVKDFMPHLELAASLGWFEDGERQERSDHTLSSALGIQSKPTRRPDGKPDATAGFYVSSSHAGSLTLGLAGSQPVGCDIEPVQEWPSERWEALLGPSLSSLSRRITDQCGCDLNEARTRTWAATEALKKLGHLDPSTVNHVRSEPDGWDLLNAGDTGIAVCSLTIGSDPKPKSLAIAVASPAYSRQVDRNRTVRRVYEYRHVVGFEESNLVGNVYFVNYLKWQGRCREMFLRDHAPSLLADLERDLALVTTRVSCQFFAELRPFDEVLIRMTLTSLEAESLRFSFEYLKVVGDREELVARGEQSVACMTRDSTDLKPRAIPEVLKTALQGYA